MPSLLTVRDRLSMFIIVHPCLARLARLARLALSRKRLNCRSNLNRRSVSNADLNQILSNGPDRRLRSVRHANLSEDMLHVLFHRLVADAERLRNFFIGKAVG